jgi:hypothetical protein
MRAVAAALCLALVIGGSASRAQPYTGPDGFAICPYAKGVIGKCAPLTDPAMRDYGLTAAQAGLVAMWRTIVMKPAPAPADTIVNSKPFAAPWLFSHLDEYSDYWFPDPSSVSIECGIHFRYAKEDLMQMNYAVDGRFIVLWTRNAVVPPSR